MTFSYRIGKLFRSARHLSSTFSNTFPDTNYPITLDPTLLHEGYKDYIDFAQQLYQQYQYEMLEIIGSYGFSNEIDLFCCVESRNVNANERSDTQQTAKKLLNEVFQHIRKQFLDDNSSFFEAKAKAAGYYVAYTDEIAKDKRMLSFPWLFASQLLAHFEDEETNDFMESSLSTNSPIYHWLNQQDPFIFNLPSNDDDLTLTEILEFYFQAEGETTNEQSINLAEMLIEQLVKFSKTT
jgi:hypothetical protein